MSKTIFNFQTSAAPFQCPLAPFTQQLSPAFGRVSDMDFFPEGLFLSSKIKASAFFNASVDTLNKWIDKGLITTYKRGRIYFFPVSGLAHALNDPGIMAFVKKKAIIRCESKKKRKNSTKVKYWIMPDPDGEIMYVRILYKGISMVWICLATIAQSQKELETFISGVINLYFKCQNTKPHIYEKN